MKKALFIAIIFFNCMHVLLAQKIVKTKFYDNNNRVEMKYDSLFDPGVVLGEHLSDEWTTKTIYDNGKTKIEGRYYRGLWDGVWKKYTRDGVVIFEGNFDKGNAIGEQKYFYPSGKIRAIYNFQNGKKEGVSFEFDEKGDTTNFIYFENDNYVKAVINYKDYILEKKYIKGENKKEYLYTLKSKTGIKLVKGLTNGKYKIGEWIGYDSLGNKIASVNFLPGDTTIEAQSKCLGPHCINDIGELRTGYGFVEKMPEFVGGDDQLIKFLTKNISYPTYAQATEMQGKFYVLFKINAVGETENLSFVHAEIYSVLLEEAIRVVEKMPNWIPGEQDGKKIIVSYALPVVFRLN